MRATSREYTPSGQREADLKRKGREGIPTQRIRPLKHVSLRLGEVNRSNIVLSSPQSAFANHHEGLHLLSKRGFFDAESTAKEVAEAKKLIRPPKPLPTVDTLEKTQSQQIQHAGKNLNGESLSTTANPETTANVESFITKGHEKAIPKIHDDSGTVFEADTINLINGKADLSVKIPVHRKPAFYHAFFQRRFPSEQKSMKYCFPVLKEACTFTGVFSGFKKFASKSSKWLRPKSNEFEHVGLLSPLPKRRRPLETPPDDGPYYSATMLAVDHNTIQRAQTI
ncbi:uncharacterized protein MELLADRAFT_101549 [Melampsora larici-populina 98AG31]|uniref:Uncharacterized protein n=1 Tax=Melampsora larici-populina (strain 98AG31 / pathotype 3-4-7) TaxID=747676 RepID=F4R676_MELLP|nr:uncharacterized protein MELLADRAFT_101549 [Melampsora larici-populina 98AG31]EGG12515.1 hypothetical protein MELLADRAFT_101549 [Melampsora larici-populina 98AG31]